MTQPLLVPFICSRCGRELVWACVAANVYCPACKHWVKPSGETVRRLTLGKVKMPDRELGQLKLFDAK
ncbi:MAG: hypothetical protein N2491_06440 [Negativicutes bacterium]|nr:hypothetical protein [Negativicutes bacterium]